MARPVWARAEEQRPAHTSVSSPASRAMAHLDGQTVGWWSWVHVCVTSRTGPNSEKKYSSIRAVRTVPDGNWSYSSWRVTYGNWRATDRSWRVTDSGWRVTDSKFLSQGAA